MNVFTKSVIAIVIMVNSITWTEQYKSYRSRQIRVKYTQSHQKSLSDYCTECCKNPDPTAECKKLCGNCEMYNDEGKQGANNFPGN